MRGAIAAAFLAAAIMPASAADLVFHEAPPPVRRAEGWMPPALADVFSRLTDAERHRDPMDPGCVVTWTHEGTHGVSHLASKVHKRQDRLTIYLLDGHCITLQHPGVSILEVAAAVPREDWEGQPESMFTLYLVNQQQYFNDEPLYLLEEWVGYTHGAIVRQQAGKKDREDTIWRARLMERWCRVMARVSREMDPEAPDLDAIDAFIEWNAARMPEAAE
jgi:hypothetical protein